MSPEVAHNQNRRQLDAASVLVYDIIHIVKFSVDVDTGQQ